MALRTGVRSFSMLREIVKQPAFIKPLKEQLDHIDQEGKPGALLQPMKLDNPHKLAAKMVLFMCLSFFQPFVITYMHMKG
ncbi:unnamed protein product [Trichobilharzia szidati]|nr:unnamed protein product [Trichobilharzia szidati]